MMVTFPLSTDNLTGPVVAEVNSPYLKWRDFKEMVFEDKCGH